MAKLNLAIIGVGLIGGSLGLALKDKLGDDIYITGMCRTQKSMDLAVLQIGARNMQNFQLLKEVGRAGKPVMLKRGLCATIKEWLNAAEYIMSAGCDDVIFCERGIRTYETYTRNTLDLSAVVAIKELSHLPIIVDPSHATGRRSMVRPMSMAAIAAGADGVIIEVHPHPEIALCDGDQSLRPEDFKFVMEDINRMSELLRGGR